MLVQQIQMAVSAGYLNHQILNQPLAPQTLVLLNQLLQQVGTDSMPSIRHASIVATLWRAICAPDGLFMSPTCYLIV